MPGGSNSPPHGSRLTIAKTTPCSIKSGRPCNGPKNNRFAVFSKQGDVLPIERKRGDPARKPPAGAKVLLHPRLENPLDYLMLDIGGGTFRFVPIGRRDSREFKRAEYTIEILALNRRALDGLARIPSPLPRPSHAFPPNFPLIPNHLHPTPQFPPPPPAYTGAGHGLFSTIRHSRH
jgi:hypothetical protein